MRRVIDLPARNWRTGLSAHDVFMAICAPEVIVTRSLRQAGTATVPSRWLQRLDAVLTSLGMNSALDRGHASLSWLAQLTPTPEVKSVSRPVPVPPLATRPRKFSATEVDSWIADPYGIYAKKILKLRQLDDLDRAPDAALRGNLFHDALAIFINRFPSGPLPDNALAELSAIGKDVFASQWQNPGVQFFWWPRFMAVAKWFVSQEQVRRQNITHSYAEVKGEIVIEGPAGPVKFTVRADRLDLDETGMWHVIDYKTGSAPSATKVAKGRRTQLLIEALIAAEGGFESLAAAEVGAMQYWQLSGARGKIAVPTNVMPDDWQPTDTRTHLSDLVKLFDDPATPYPSEPDIKQRPAFSPYRHLARVAEWQAEDGDE
jgi:ATP-dependent helicase/nuclease subunit B